MKRTMAILAALVLAGAVILVLSACAAEDQARAQAADAEAARTRAAAEAYEQRQAADSQAAAERAATRQMEADRNYSRVISALPYVALFLGAFGVGGLSLLVFWDRGRRPASTQGQAPALPPPAINVFVLPPPSGGRRADQWRQLEAAAKREVTIYQDSER